MIDVTVKLKGKLAIEGVADRIVQKQIQHELIGAIGDRLTRKGSKGSGGTGLGVRRNTITRAPDRFNTVELRSTAVFPRTKGTAWKRKNMGIVKAMAPRVLNKTARRIEEEMGL